MSAPQANATGRIGSKSPAAAISFEELLVEDTVVRISVVSVNFHQQDNPFVVVKETRE